MDLSLFHRPGLPLQALSDVSFIISQCHIAVSLDSLMEVVIQKKKTFQPPFQQPFMNAQTKNRQNFLKYLDNMLCFQYPYITAING